LEDSTFIYLMKRTEKQVNFLRSLCNEWQQDNKFWTFDEILQSIQRPSYLAYFAANCEECEWQGFILVDIGPFSADIMYVYVRQSARGRGLGWRLLCEVERALVELEQMENLFLEVRVSNESAIHLYEKFGMRRVGVRKGYYRDGEDAYVYAKTLKG
jgi:ribosomal-protein-alanine acetyltransferase